jgi:hypothetical protein
MPDWQELIIDLCSTQSVLNYQEENGSCTLPRRSWKKKERCSTNKCTAFVETSELFEVVALKK